MAISIKNLHQVKAHLPPRVLIYGPPGIGKTTLASEFPNPVWLQVEDGVPSDLALNSFGRLTTYDEVMEAIAALYTEEHQGKTVVLDFGEFTAKIQLTSANGPTINNGSTLNVANNTHSVMVVKAGAVYTQGAYAYQNIEGIDQVNSITV